MSRRSRYRLMLCILFFFLGLGRNAVIEAQSSLTSSEIAEGEALGKTTAHSLKFGTYAFNKGDTCKAFILSPVQRIAYTTSEELSTHHQDILKNEIHLNRLRIYGLCNEQHQSREVLLFGSNHQQRLVPVRLVLDMNQAIAEFDMTAVLRLSAPAGKIMIEITDETGAKHALILFRTSDLKHNYKKFDNEFFR